MSSLKEVTYLKVRDDVCFNSELVFISFAVYMVDCILQQHFTFLTSYKLTINNSSEMTTVSITAQFANFFLSSLPE